MRLRRNSWLGRLVRGRRPDRNPLRRGSDLAETAMLCLLVAAFVGGAPIAAHAAGSWTYANSARQARAQEATVRQVRATLLQPAQAWSNAEGGGEASARWKAPDGQVITGQVFLPGGTAGSTVMIWVNRSGQLAGAPLQPGQLTGQANMVRALAVVGLAVTLIIVGLTGRWALDRRRLAAWGAEWLANGPSWTSRR